MMEDIPLKDAIIAWHRKDGDKSEVVVGWHPEEPGSPTKPFWFTMGPFKWGKKRTKDEHLVRLFRTVMRMVVDLKVDPQRLHTALLVIPEYRELLGIEEEP